MADKNKNNYGYIKHLIEEYGIDNIKKEYCVDGISANEIANKLGIDRAALYRYFAKHDISKKKSSAKNRKKTIIDGTVTKVTFNIDKCNAKEKRLLHKLETKMNNVKSCACNSCAYKNREIGYCWYTIITNRKRKEYQNNCYHYVDINTINDEINRE